MQNYEDVREELKQEGYVFEDDDFEYFVNYARRKAEVAGKDESYLPLLIPDVVKEYFFRTYVTLKGMMAMETQNK